MKAYRLVGYGRSLVTGSMIHCSRRNTSSTKQSRGQRSDHPLRTRQQAIILGRINTRERWDKRELVNIWEENCYHRIKCSASNPLATLMWKWYMNSNFQVYSYLQRFQEGDDGTSIKEINNLTYTWRAEMKEMKEI